MVSDCVIGSCAGRRNPTTRACSRLNSRRWKVLRAAVYSHYWNPSVCHLEWNNFGWYTFFFFFFSSAFFFFKPFFFFSRGLDQWLLLSRGGGVIKTIRSLYCFLSECNTNSNSSLDCHRVRYQWLLNGCEDTFSHCYGSVPQLKMLRKWKEFCDCSLKAKISNLVVYQRAREWDKGIKLACGIEATSRNSYHLQAIWNSCSFYLCIGLESVPCVGVILPQVYRVVGALASCHYLTFPR